jgi:hypothetical protein
MSWWSLWEKGSDEGKGGTGLQLFEVGMHEWFDVEAVGSPKVSL